MKHALLRLGAFSSLGLLLAGVVLDCSHAAVVKLANLQVLTEESERIFVGECRSIGSDTIDNIPFTTYDFRVVEAIKGVTGDQVVVRQYGLIRPIPIGNGLARATRVEGMPKYETGKHYLLFLVKESPIGLSSPVGLFQGAFASTARGFVNSVENRNLARGLSDSWLRRHGLLDEQVTRLVDIKRSPIESTFFLEVLKKIVTGGR